ncbi:MAG: hypothetical protein ACR2GQ_01215 [Gemmatimonadota bacterium]
MTPFEGAPRQDYRGIGSYTSSSGDESFRHAQRQFGGSIAWVVEFIVLAWTGAAVEELFFHVAGIVDAGM